MKIGQCLKTNSISEYDNSIKYNYYAYYTNLFQRELVERKFPHFKCLCPFHNDTRVPNLDINIVTGTMKCYACGKVASVSEFICTEDNGHYVYNLPNVLSDTTEIVKHKNYVTHTKKKELTELDLRIEENRSIQAHAFLFATPLALRQLQERGVSIKTIIKWRIGFGKGTYSIPIYDINNKMASLKFHKRFQTEGAHNQLYPWNAVHFKVQMVVLVEGEFDMYMLQQVGINAVTQTAGANSWNPNFTNYFKNKKVFIAYDNDQPGKVGAQEVYKQIKKVNKNVYIVKWPDYMLKGEDHVDYFVKYKKTVTNYSNLLTLATRQ